jgi:hypothetical protein
VSNVADTSYLDAYFLTPDYESNGSGFRLASRQQITVATPGTNRPMGVPLIGSIPSAKHNWASILDNLINFKIHNHSLSARGAAPFYRFQAHAPSAAQFLQGSHFEALIATGIPRFGSNLFQSLLNSDMTTIPTVISTVLPI